MKANEDYPLISIIVPVYNVLKYLEKCVSSLEKQTYNNYEILLVDDGSTDGCGKRCDKLAETYSNIQVFHKINGGLSSARNYGLDNCQGEYVFFVDSDDYIHPKLLSDLYRLSELYKADIVECDYTVISEDHELLWKEYLPDRKIRIYSRHEALERVLDYNGICIVAWNKLYKRNLFDEIRFPEGKLNEDEFTTPQIINSCNVYVKTSNSYYAYVQRKGSIMNSEFSLAKLDILDAHKMRLECFKDCVSHKCYYNMKYHYWKKLNHLLCMVRKNLNDDELCTNLENESKQLLKELMFSRHINFLKKGKLIYFKILDNKIIVREDI